MMEAKEAYSTAIALGLDVRLGLTDEQVELIYNGTGAEWMPEGLRTQIDRFSETLQPAVCAHDIRYYFGDGTYGDFCRANDELVTNGRICADARYAWYNPMRYIVRRQAKIFSRICERFGWSAYIDAIKERKHDEYKNERNDD